MDLRLVITPDCNRRCKGCCNKQFDLYNLPLVESYSGYEKIMLTGGEPMLYPHRIKELVQAIRRETDAQIILYTAWREEDNELMEILNYVDGITLTLHTRKDTEPFESFAAKVAACDVSGKSLRLNVFHGVSTGNADLSKWNVKSNIRWIKDCPVPVNEVLMRDFQ